MKPYNPLDYDNLTLNLVREMMDRGPDDLPLGDRFNGPGVYALFYSGDFEPYAPFRSPDAKQPIYVGKAVPPGARKGKGEQDLDSPALYNRLREHCDSIGHAQNLDLAHFQCRFLTVVPLWITMAERFLIEHYQPLWNVCIEGFGLHDPGKGRKDSQKSWWDTLHAGRPWANNLRETKTMEEALLRIDSYYEGD